MNWMITIRKTFINDCREMSEYISLKFACLLLKVSSQRKAHTATDAVAYWLYFAPQSRWNDESFRWLIAKTLKTAKSFRIYCWVRRTAVLLFRTRAIDAKSLEWTVPKRMYVLSYVKVIATSLECCQFSQLYFPMPNRSKVYCQIRIIGRIH